MGPLRAILPANQAQGTINKCLQENGERWTNPRSSILAGARDGQYSAGVWAWLIVCATLSMRIIVNKMASYHDRAAECARKSLLTLLEAEIKPLIMALVRIKCGGFI